jgi:catechol 2,3-dioxygenase-like lactoylglutathione lyase family enzyme
MGIAMDHIVLNAEDEEKMIDFYHEVLGLQPERLAAYRRGDVPFPSVRINVGSNRSRFRSSTEYEPLMLGL